MRKFPSKISFRHDRQIWKAQGSSSTMIPPTSGPSLTTSYLSPGQRRLTITLRALVLILWLRIDENLPLRPHPKDLHWHSPLLPYPLSQQRHPLLEHLLDLPNRPSLILSLPGIVLLQSIPEAKTTILPLPLLHQFFSLFKFRIPPPWVT